MNDAPPLAAVYGRPAASLAAVPADAAQLSPLLPGSRRIEDLSDESLCAVTVLAPPGTQERAFVLVHAMRTLKPGAGFTVLAPKAAGGTRLMKELAALGAECLADNPKAHYRIVTGQAPRTAPEDGQLWPRVMALSGPQLCAKTGLWTQPGVFSWNRLDPGTALLLSHLPPLAGRGADYGCGIGHLAIKALASAKVSALICADVDRRAVEAARRNINDPRTSIVWADAVSGGLDATGLDFVVMNPPFHDGGAEDRALGQAFARAAATALRPGGRCWLVANRHLPYEAVLADSFTSVAMRAQANGFKVFEAVR